MKPNGRRRTRGYPFVVAKSETTSKDSRGLLKHENDATHIYACFCWKFAIIDDFSVISFMNSIFVPLATHTHTHTHTRRCAISTNKEVDERFAQGSRNRSVGAHNINEHSSRSHLLLSLKCVGRNLANDSETVSQSVIKECAIA